MDYCSTCYLFERFTSLQCFDAPQNTIRSFFNMITLREKLQNDSFLSQGILRIRNAYV